MAAEDDPKPPPRETQAVALVRSSLGDSTLELPPDWHRSSVVSAPTPPGHYAPNLVISRDRLRPDETPATYCARQLVDLARHLRQFKLHGRRELTIGGRVAHEIACGWAGQQGPIEQRITIVAHEGGVVTCTATMPRPRAAELAPLFERIVASLELGG